MRLLVEQLTLRLAEVSAGDPHALSQSIFERLERRLPADATASLGSLQLKVTIPAHATQDDVADAIANALMRGLRS
ncbi:hypothetical protein BH09MYX1_BH09MYX1_08490 [soil metagenome]